MAICHDFSRRAFFLPKVGNSCSSFAFKSSGIASPAIFFRGAALVYRSASFNVAQPKMDIR
jgi:hypothetical protein